jgi:hypothetical protein
MELRSSRPQPSADVGPEVVAAPTLGEALRRARRRYGSDVRIHGSRTVKRPSRLGEERWIEVLVELPTGESARAEPAQRNAGIYAAAAPDATEEIARELARIEKLIAAITRREGGTASPRGSAADAAAETLIAAGARPPTAARWLERWREERGDAPKSGAALLEFAAGHLVTSRAHWTSFGGCHLFLGGEGCGKTELVLATAAKLQGVGRRPLVLSLLPNHPGVVRRLQAEASRHEYDAAILRDVKQFERSLTRFDGYDAVLVDTPALLEPLLGDRRELQDRLGQAATVHCHVVVPLDADLRDLDPLWQAARGWQCDWLAVTRTDRSALPGKVLDLAALSGLPFSLLASDPWARRRVEIASEASLQKLLSRADDALRHRGAAAEA